MNERKTIAIIGCGQLGSRHLQAILKVGVPLTIYVVEPNFEARTMAHQRASEIPISQDIVIEWHSNLSQIPHAADLTIVATLAQERPAILERLLLQGHRRFLIEKIVCQSSAQYRRLISLFKKNGATGWLNITRRYFPVYQQALLVSNQSPVFLSVWAGDFGLASNAIHYFDIFEAMIKGREQITLSGDLLTPQIQANRRGKGLVEFSGTILGRTPKGSLASVTFYPQSQISGVVMITTKSFRAFINEGAGKALVAYEDRGWRWEEQTYQELYTSQLTTEIARTILNEGTCLLPTLEHSYSLHKELFRIFNRHLKKLTGRRPDLCPIT